MSGALVPMGTGVPAGMHQNFKIVGTAGPSALGTGFRENFRRWVKSW